jgi:hypothetical protein
MEKKADREGEECAELEASFARHGGSESGSTPAPVCFCTVEGKIVVRVWNGKGAQKEAPTWTAWSPTARSAPSGFLADGDGRSLDLQELDHVSTSCP